MGTHLLPPRPFQRDEASSIPISHLPDPPTRPWINGPEAPLSLPAPRRPQAGRELGRLGAHGCQAPAHTAAGEAKWSLSEASGNGAETGWGHTGVLLTALVLGVASWREQCPGRVPG